MAGMLKLQFVHKTIAQINLWNVFLLKTELVFTSIETPLIRLLSGNLPNFSSPCSIKAMHNTFHSSWRKFCREKKYTVLS